MELSEFEKKMIEDRVPIIMAQDNNITEKEAREYATQCIIDNRELAKTAFSIVSGNVL